MWPAANFTLLKGSQQDTCCVQPTTTLSGCCGQTGTVEAISTNTQSRDSTGHFMPTLRIWKRRKFCVLDASEIQGHIVGHLTQLVPDTPLWKKSIDEAKYSQISKHPYLQEASKETMKIATLRGQVWSPNYGGGGFVCLWNVQLCPDYPSHRK